MHELRREGPRKPIMCGTTENEGLFFGKYFYIFYIFVLNHRIHTPQILSILSQKLLELNSYNIYTIV